LILTLKNNFVSKQQKKKSYRSLSLTFFSLFNYTKKKQQTAAQIQRKFINFNVSNMTNDKMNHHVIRMIISWVK